MANEKVLVADESPAIVDMIGTALEEEKFKVIAAYDGRETLRKVYTERPSLVLLNLDMPKMSGYLVCKRLKEDPETKNIPVITLSAKDREIDKMWGLGMGADECLTKPIEVEKMVGIIKEKLKQKVR